VSISYRPRFAQGGVSGNRRAAFLLSLLQGATNENLKVMPEFHYLST
jgi:hypothetical protein